MTRYAEASADVMYKESLFADALPRQTKKFWNRLGILLPTYLASKFRRVIFISLALDVWWIPDSLNRTLLGLRGYIIIIIIIIIIIVIIIIINLF